MIIIILKLLINAIIYIYLVPNNFQLIIYINIYVYIWYTIWDLNSDNSKTG
jgi:hypothetical protein